MPNGRPQTSNLELNIPTYLSLPDAAKKFDLPQAAIQMLRSVFYNCSSIIFAFCSLNVKDNFC